MPLSSLADVGEPRIGVVSDSFKQPLAFEATGISQPELDQLDSRSASESACAEFFAVYLVSDREELSPTPISGSYLIDRGRMTFVPFHRLRAGVKYRAVLQIPGVAITGQSTSTMITVHCEIAIPGQSLDS